MVRALIVIGALSGLIGVIAAAAGRHSNGANLTIAADFLLFHAPALLAIAALLALGALNGSLATASGLILALGLVLFCGDLAARDIRHSPLFPGAAPTGGIALMIGWALVPVAALLGR